MVKKLSRRDISINILNKQYIGAHKDRVIIIRISTNCITLYLDFSLINVCSQIIIYQA